MIESLGPGGAERLLHTNLSCFRPAVESLVCHLYDRDPFWREPIRRLGVPVVSLSLNRFWQPWRAVRRLRGVVRSFEPDLIHTHLYGANIYGRIAGRLDGVPVLSSIHNPDYEPEAVRTSRQALVVALYRRLDAITARWKCVSFLAVSRYVRDSAVRRLGLDPSRITVIHNPVESREFEQVPAGRMAALRGGLELPAGAPVLLSVGRLDPQKGQDVLLRALPAVRKRHPHAVLLVVGEGAAGWREELVGLARRAAPPGSVRFLGVRDDIPDLLSACDVFVFPSRFEGLGIALIEAMAAGCACVASDLPAIREVVDHEVDAWVVPPGDAGALASAICDVLDAPDRRAETGQRARAKVTRRFDVSNAVPRLEALYRALAAVPPPSLRPEVIGRHAG